MRKHLVAAALASVCLAGLTGCEQNATDKPSQATPPANPASASNNYAAPIPQENETVAAANITGSPITPPQGTGESSEPPANAQSGPMLATSPDGAPAQGGMPPEGGMMQGGPDGGMQGGVGQGDPGAGQGSPSGEQGQNMSGDQSVDQAPEPPAGGFSGSAVVPPAGDQQ